MLRAPRSPECLLLAPTSGVDPPHWTRCLGTALLASSATYMTAGNPDVASMMAEDCGMISMTAGDSGVEAMLAGGSGMVVMTSENSGMVAVTG